MASEEPSCRLKSGLRIIDGRWYVVVSIWNNDEAAGEPLSEFVGPKGGFATKQEALISHHEKVAPITEKLMDDCIADGVNVQDMIEHEILH